METTYGPAVDRLVRFHQATHTELKERLIDPTDTVDVLDAVIGIQLDHQTETTMAYGNLPGVWVNSPQPDVFIIGNDLYEDTVEFDSLVKAVSFFADRISDAMRVTITTPEDELKRRSDQN